jgi:hypothetical protein
MARMTGQPKRLGQQENQNGRDSRKAGMTLESWDDQKAGTTGMPGTVNDRNGLVHHYFGKLVGSCQLFQ